MGMHLPPSPQRAQGEKAPSMKQRASLQQILKKDPAPQSLTSQLLELRE